jgi:8-oxo-dGTP pyrophosphatase MutT (NUDIX family)
MRQIDYNDLKNYQDCKEKKTRTACRAIIIHNDKLAMIQSTKFQELKFPGGGMEDGENHMTCLIREVLEETGLMIQSSSISPYGLVTDIRRSLFEKDLIFEMNSYYYLAEMDDTRKGETKLDTYEMEYGYQLVWVSIDEAILKNDIAFEKFNVEAPWVERELKVLKMLKEEGVLK